MLANALTDTNSSISAKIGKPDTLFTNKPRLVAIAIEGSQVPAKNSCRQRWIITRRTVGRH